MNRPRLYRPDAGNKFVVRRSQNDGSYAYEIATTFYNGEGLPCAFFSDGTIGKWNSNSNKIEGDHEWSVYYDFPLPALSTQDQIRYAKAIRGHHVNEDKTTPDHVVLSAFRIEFEAGGSTFLKMLSWSVGYDREHRVSDGYKGLTADFLNEMSVTIGSFHTSLECYAVEASCLPAEIEIGDIVVCDDFDFSDGGKGLTLRNPCVPILRTKFISIADVFPARTNSHTGTFRTQFDQISLAPIGELLHRLEVAKRSGEPDVALVIAIPTENKAHSGESIISIVSRKGQAFYIDAYYGHIHGELLNDLPDPGIYVAEEPRCWSYTTHEGEHESGVEVYLRPATLEDLNLFDQDVKSLGAAIRNHINDHADEVSGEFVAEARKLTDDDLTPLLIDWQKLDPAVDKVKKVHQK